MQKCKMVEAKMNAQCKNAKWSKQKSQRKMLNAQCKIVESKMYTANMQNIARKTQPYRLQLLRFGCELVVALLELVLDNLRLLPLLFNFFANRFNFVDRLFQLFFQLIDLV